MASWVSTLGLSWTRLESPDGVRCTFTPAAEHRGPPGYLHGGLAAALLDETMAAVSIVLEDVHTVTGTLSLRYPHPVPIDGQPLRIEAWRTSPRRVEGQLVLADGTVAVTATGMFIRAS